MTNAATAYTEQSQKTIQALKAAQLIGIIRTDNAESALWASQILLETGFQALEITFTVPQAATVIQQLVTQFPDRLIGAGTVLSLSEAEAAQAAGACFLVSPIFKPELLSWSQQAKLLYLPGVMTPNEALHAHQQGVQALKFFPASCAGGPAFLKAMQGPFPALQFVPTGGIERDDIQPYLQAGALAVGVGGALLPKQALAKQDVEQLKMQASTYLQVISS